MILAAQLNNQSLYPECSLVYINRERDELAISVRHSAPHAWRHELEARKSQEEPRRARSVAIRQQASLEPNVERGRIGRLPLP